jgi:hypothetical protein
LRVSKHLYHVGQPILHRCRRGTHLRVWDIHFEKLPGFLLETCPSLRLRLTRGRHYVRTLARLELCISLQFLFVDFHEDQRMRPPPAGTWRFRKPSTLVLVEVLTPSSRGLRYANALEQVLKNGGSETGESLQPRRSRNYTAAGHTM